MASENENPQPAPSPSSQTSPSPPSSDASTAQTPEEPEQNHSVSILEHENHPKPSSSTASDLGSMHRPSRPASAMTQDDTGRNGASIQHSSDSGSANGQNHTEVSHQNRNGALDSSASSQVGVPIQSNDSDRSLVQQTEEVPHGWRPRYIRKWVLATFIIIFLLLAVAIVVLYVFSRKRNGLTAANESLYYLWMFSPTIVFTILLSFWHRVEYQIKRYTPWMALAYQPGPSSSQHRTRQEKDSWRALFLDYTTMAQPRAVYEATRRRYRLVTLSILMSWIFFVQITLSTGLLELESMRMDERVELTVHDHFEPITVPDGSVFSRNLPAATVNGIALLNMSLPIVHRIGNAMQSIDIISPSSSSSFGDYVSMETETDVTWLDTRCTPLDVSTETWTEEAMPDYYGLFVYLNSSHCDSFRHVISSAARYDMPGNGKNYFWVYSERGVCNLPGSGSNATQAIIAAVIEVDKTPDEFIYVASSSIACQVSLNLAEAASISLRNGVNVDVWLERARRNATLDSDMTRFMALFRDDQRGEGDDQQIHTGTDYLETLFLSPYRLGARLVQGAVPSVQDLLRQDKLEELIRVWIDASGSVISHYLSRKPSAEPAVRAARGVVLQQRLVVKDSTAWSMVAVLLLMAAMALYMIFEASRTIGFSPFITRDPDTIAGCAALLSKSTNLLGELRGTGDSNLSSLKKTLQGAAYRTAIVRDPSSSHESHFCLIRDDAPEVTGSESPSSGDGGKRPYTFRPWSLRLVSRILCAIYIVSLIVAVAVLYRKSNSSGGLLSPGDNSYVHYWWSVVPTVFMEGLAIYLTGCDFNIRFLNPMVTLQNREASFIEAVGISYANAWGPVVLYRAIRHRNWNVVLSKVIAFLAILLPIITNALFSVEIGEERTAIQLQQQTWFASDDAETLSLEAPSVLGGMLLVGPNSNVTFPSWTYEEYAIHRQAILSEGLGSGDDAGMAIQASVPAVGVDMECSWVPTTATIGVDPEPPSLLPILSVDYGGKGLSCLRNIQCRNYTYFGGVLSGGTQSRSCGVTGIPLTNYIWGACSDDKVLFIAGLNCSEVAREVDLDVRLLGPQMRLDTVVRPPSPREGSTRPHGFHGDAVSLYDFLDYESTGRLDRSRNVFLHGFFDSLTASRWSVPLERLGSEAAKAEVAAAIKKHHGILRAQTLNHEGKPAAANSPAIRLTFDNDLPPPKYPPFTAEQPAPIAASIRTTANRLLQKRGATWTTIGILALIFVLHLVSMATTKHVKLHKPPGSIASVASLLADSPLFDYLPDDAWRQSDEVLSRHLDGARFRIGRFPAAGGGQRNGLLVYTIGVVEDREAIMGNLPSRSGPEDDRDAG